MIPGVARQRLRPLVYATALGTSGYAAYFLYTSRKLEKTGTTFEIPVKMRGSDGKATTVKKPISYLTPSEIEKKLTENATSTSVPRPSDGITWKYDTAFLASNEVIEDANSQLFIKKEDKALSRSPAGDLLFFAVMDGHAGYFTSRLLAKTLIPAVALELATLSPEAVAASRPSGFSPSSIWSYLKSFVTTSNSASATMDIKYPYDSDPKYVSTAIQTAFANLDSNIINTPIRLLDELSKSKQALDPKSQEFQLAVTSLLPALSGSCALLTMIDTAHKDLYVACTGDSRAVAGYWDESADGTGKWRVEVLTEDQTGRNIKELERIRSEHPPEESSHVIQRGRILGGLEPSRAFGDANYKWSRDFQQRVAQLLDGSGKAVRRIPQDLKTPPYVTSRPEITHRKLEFLRSAASTNVGNGDKSTLRFVVLATDGLWDQLSSSEVVSLVGEYLNRANSGVSGPAVVPKADLALTVSESHDASGFDGKSAQVAQEREKAKHKGSWAFVDNNISTHLIRNAFGGANGEELRQLISIPAPFSRRFRDDVTVTVVWYEDGVTEQKVIDTKAKL
ncbi:hypothetical protein FRC03_006577 [Tulasnella sp. 419]|nr:hypothetical protein FRC03_006577 [Tulasnella sp. 419]